MARGSIMKELTNHIQESIQEAVGSDKFDPKNYATAEEYVNANQGNIWYHSTEFDGDIDKFNSTEVWFESQGMPGYGERDVAILYDIQKPFVTTPDEDLQNDYGVTPEEAEQNAKLYAEWGGESNPESFQHMRDLGYDTLIDSEGHCALYPDKVKVVGQHMVINKHNVPDADAMLTKIWLGEEAQ